MQEDYKPINKIYTQKVQPPKKVKYVQKTIIKTENKQLNHKTKVINIRVKQLRQMGYDSLEEWLKDDNHVYIGRNMTHYVPGAQKSKWHNPFKVQNSRQKCLQQFRQYILKNKPLLSQIKQLKGKVLGCWCHPQGCHGHILAELADAQ